MIITMNILIINGIYDIICFFSILFKIKFISRLHLGLFKNKQELIVERLLAYWILTYGLIRLSTGIYNYKQIGSITYLIEAGCFEYELLVNNDLIKSKIRFVSIISILLWSYINII